LNYFHTIADVTGGDDRLMSLTTEGDQPQGIKEERVNSRDAARAECAARFSNPPIGEISRISSLAFRTVST
jgi:hypothetical protein